MNRFANMQQRRMYDICRQQAKLGAPVSSGVSGEAYAKGRAGLRHQWPRSSLAYAAWAAGRDDRKVKP